MANKAKGKPKAQAKPKRVASSKGLAKATPAAAKPKPAAKPVAVAPRKSTRPSIPVPPPPPAPPPQRDELGAMRDVSRLLRYGERFGAHKIDVRMLPMQLPSGNRLAMLDPTTPKSWRVLDRPVGGGQFRVMLSIAHRDAPDGSRTEQLAAIVLHVGRPPIAKWTVAQIAGVKKSSSGEPPRVTITSGTLVLVDAGDAAPSAIEIPASPTTSTIPGVSTTVLPVEVPLGDGRRALAVPSGKGEFAAYWAVDAADKPVCLVVDFDVFKATDWKQPKSK